MFSLGFGRLCWDRWDLVLLIIFNFVARSILDRCSTNQLPFISSHWYDGDWARFSFIHCLVLWMPDNTYEYMHWLLLCDGIVRCKKCKVLNTVPFRLSIAVPSLHVERVLPALYFVVAFYYECTDTWSYLDRRSPIVGKRNLYFPSPVSLHYKTSFSFAEEYPHR